MLCHFHFPSTEEDYLVQLRGAYSASGISFDTLLLDYGDLTASEESRRMADFEFIRRWIGIASLCGAKQIRVIAGEAPPADEVAIRRSAAALSELAEYARAQGVRVVTENFKPLTSTGESCMKLLGLAGSRVGMITDFRNFNGQAKYGEIAMTVPYSVSVHAKAEYDEAGIPNVEGFRRCLDAVKSVGYDGAYVLIYDGPGNMWEGLERIKRLVQPYITN